MEQFKSGRMEEFSQMMSVVLTYPVEENVWDSGIFACQLWDWFMQFVDSFWVMSRRWSNVDILSSGAYVRSVSRLFSD